MLLKYKKSYWYLLPAVLFLWFIGSTVRLPIYLNKQPFFIFGFLILLLVFWEVASGVALNHSWRAAISKHEHKGLFYISVTAQGFFGLIGICLGFI